MTDHSALIERLEGDATNWLTADRQRKEAAAALRDLAEWRDIETFDAIPTKHKPRPAVFYFEPLIEGRTHLSATVELSRTFGRRLCTHWLPLPSAPNQAKEAGE